MFLIYFFWYYGISLEYHTYGSIISKNVDVDDALEEMSEMKCIICFKEFRTVAEWREHSKCEKEFKCVKNVVRGLKLSSGMKGM